MPLSMAQFRAMTWVLAFKDETVGISVYRAEGLNGITITHDEDQAGGKMRIRYRTFGRWFDSPSEAVRHFNASGGRDVANCVEPAGRSQRILRRR